MKFGKVDNPELIDFKLPEDDLSTQDFLTGKKNKPNVYIGCAKWNRTDLKGFYPRGTKDELSYYSTQFNSIELNATFYSIPSKEQVEIWRDKTPDDFKFFPKISNSISHFRRLNNVNSLVDEFCLNVSHFEEKLGMVFLQLHDNFASKNFDRLQSFISAFPSGIPLAIELRSKSWFEDEVVSNELYALFDEKKVTNILVDSAGRRDLLHMRLTTPTAFIRYVGANHATDYSRLDDWIERLNIWINNGLENLYFFVHQNIEKESPLLSTYFIEKLNSKFDLNVRGPKETGLF